MYYAAGIAGADPNSRCIGVAVSKKAFGPFTPVGNAPLVCPVVPGVPRAADNPPTKVLGKRSQTRGVIDPSSFIGNNGQRFLVYRTQGQPSSIRLVKLSQRGRRIQAGQTSMFLTNHPGIEENPVIIRHDDKWVMFTSVGWFGHCGYRTYWRRSPDFRDWSRADAQAAPVDGQRPVRPGRRRRAAAPRRPHPALLPRVDLLPRALPVPARLEQGPGRRSGRACGRCTAPTCGGRPPAGRVVESWIGVGAAAATAADSEPHADPDADSDAEPDGHDVADRQHRRRRPSTPTVTDTATGTPTVTDTATP